MILLFRSFEYNYRVCVCEDLKKKNEMKASPKQKQKIYLIKDRHTFII